MLFAPPSGAMPVCREVTKSPSVLLKPGFPEGPGSPSSKEETMGSFLIITMKRFLFRTVFNRHKLVG